MLSFRSISFLTKKIKFCIHLLARNLISKITRFSYINWENGSPIDHLNFRESSQIISNFLPINALVSSIRQPIRHLNMTFFHTNTQVSFIPFKDCIEMFFLYNFCSTGSLKKGTIKAYSRQKGCLILSCKAINDHNFWLYRYWASKNWNILPPKLQIERNPLDGDLFGQIQNISSGYYVGTLITFSVLLPLLASYSELDMFRVSSIVPWKLRMSQLAPFTRQVSYSSP